MKESEPTEKCAICDKTVALSESVPVSALRKSIHSLVKHKFPHTKESDHICLACYETLRSQIMLRELKKNERNLSKMEKEVLAKLESRELISTNTEDVIEKNPSFGDQLADKIAAFGGSWTFILTFMGILVVWITINSVALLGKHFDPYPFILLNLVLSCVAAMQAPVIMMSQNRQEAKDRIRSEHDYMVNLKAEIEIRALHEKMDHLLRSQMHTLMEYQDAQLELLQKISKKT
ncbi:MAG: DUF1003 domain-containing protein [Fimbriimonadaceae bacterium]|nr:MAG: DUF1003 domain-containing protein [Fimbriimonadaceae bacterium]